MWKYVPDRNNGALQGGTTLFIDIFKWIIYATGIGVVVGLSTAVFLKALGWSISAVSGYGYYFLLLPLALVLCDLIVRRMAPEARGHGTEQVIEAVHQRSGKIDHKVVPVKAVATILTIAFGGSVGKEGPSAQIGAGLSSGIADVFRLKDEDRKKLVICGISAGFAAVFGTPIAGAIFGIEVIYVGSLMYEVLLASFIAGVISYQVATSLGITYSYHLLNIVPEFNETFFLTVIAASILFGLCSVLMIEALIRIEKLAHKIPTRLPLRSFTGGVILVLLALVFSTQYMGLGTNLIDRAIQGGPLDWYAFPAKILFTGVTLGFGGSGGVITPIFVVGATAGALFAQVTGLNVPVFAAIGLVSLLAGTTKTPIASSIMAIEMFGALIGPYAAIACIISFIISGTRSVYASQVFSLKKFI
jgi:chloride channel protein, CIC family